MLSSYPQFTIKDIYDGICQCQEFGNKLNNGHRDDILACLEILEKWYGPEYFNQPLNLQNVVRLTAFKYMAFQTVLRKEVKRAKSFDLIFRIGAQVLLSSISRKLNELRRVVKQFPDYPKTNLSVAQEKLIAATLCDSVSAKTIINTNFRVSDLIMIDPGTIYYQWPK